MKEDFLHFVWRMRKFDLIGLKSTGGSPIEILSFGDWNHDAGPDFLGAKIKLDSEIWVGHVEIHVRASEWYHHKHHQDPKYDQTILHVVYEEDKQIFNNGNRLPCLVLKNKIAPKTLRQYYNLKTSHHFIPCEKLIHRVKSSEKNKWIKHLALQRMEQKVEKYLHLIESLKHDWEAVFFQNLAYYLGASKNKDQMLLMAKQIPVQLIRKHSDQCLLLEALFFGQSGLLNRDFSDEYPKLLKNEYTYLQKKHHLISVNPQVWNFFRLRPANFPTIRIAQLAGLYSSFSNPFQQLIHCKSISEIFELMSVVASEYWDTHFLFDKESSFRIKGLGEERIQLLIINVLIPMTLAFSRKTNNKRLEEKAMQWLREMPPEKNKWIAKFEEFGFEAESAMQTQGILQLYQHFCLKKKCLQCSIGNTILNDQFKN
jgi:hypothetical protein